MKKGLLIVSFCLLIFGCGKDQEITPVVEKPLPSYIKTLLVPDASDPYKGSFYIYACFTNNATSETRKLTFDERNTSMSLRYDALQRGTGLSEQTLQFIDPSTGERLEIAFYYDLATDTAFVLRIADYLFADAWNGIAGANIQYCKPVNQGEGQYLNYQGVEAEDAYFRITYLGNGFVNGIFHTTWQECCGEPTTYDVTGDFSIPLVFQHIAI